MLYLLQPSCIIIPAQDTLNPSKLAALVAETFPREAVPFNRSFFHGMSAVCCAGT